MEIRSNLILDDPVVQYFVELLCEPVHISSL